MAIKGTIGSTHDESRHHTTTPASRMYEAMGALKGFRSTASRSGAEVVDQGDGWYSAVHPETGAHLQMDDKGYYSVHDKDGSWSEGSNPRSVISSIWRGKF